MADITDSIGIDEFDNRSNFDIRASELANVVDIPVFPAQNLILDTQTVNVYDRPSKSPMYIYDDKIYALMSPHEDQRFVFLEYSETSRLLDYRFGGRIYAQSRPKGAYSLTPESFYLWAGNVGDKDDMRDLWRYDLASKTWIPEFVTGEDLSISEYPSNRRSSYLLVAGTEKFIFGGKVYVEIGDDILQLNDLWWNDGISWKVLDSNAKLPHAPGIVVSFDSSTITVLAAGSIWTVYKDGITDTTSVPYTGITPPSTEYVMSFYHDSAVYLSDYVSGKIYHWSGVSLVLDKTDTYGVGYLGSDIAYYTNETTITRRRGGDSEYQPEIHIYVPSIYQWSDGLVHKTCDIDAVPLGEYMASCDIAEGKKYLGLGLQKTTFIEDHYIWDGGTNTCARIASDSTKPQERILPGCCFDKKRNRVWLFGGYTGSIYYNDLWYLSLDDYTWTRVRHRTTDLTDNAGNDIWPGTRARSGMCVVEDTLWIVSGYSDVASYSDMWKYDIPGDFAEEEKTSDWVPFGSDYFLFEWRDRMWMFNGEYKLYRYFFGHKQFAPVTLYATRYKEIQAKIEAREYITPPIRLSLQNNSLIISYLDSEASKWTSFYVDMDSKEIIQYPEGMEIATFWYSQARCMDTSGYLYFYNVSPFDFAQRNTFPYHEYSTDVIASSAPLSRESVIMPYWDSDTVGGGGVPRLAYFDSESMYIVYDDQVDYSPLIPSVKEMQDGLLANYWPQNDFSVIDGSTGSEQEESKASIGQGRFRSIPRFLWKRIPSRYADKIRKASLAWQDETSGRTYVVNNRDGHVLRWSCPEISSRRWYVFQLSVEIVARGCDS